LKSIIVEWRSREWWSSIDKWIFRAHSRKSWRLLAMREKKID